MHGGDVRTYLVRIPQARTRTITVSVRTVTAYSVPQLFRSHNKHARRAHGESARETMAEPAEQVHALMLCKPHSQVLQPYQNQTSSSTSVRQTNIHATTGP